VAGSNGTGTDEHGEPSISGTWASYCQSTQVYQWATGWPNPPAANNEDAGWNNLASYTIKRYVENVGGWRYRITKGAWECTDEL
jgi:hypothetical protein